MRIGVFCSGGDAPGMNACVRAIVREAVGRGHEVVGILRGYHGLLNRQFYVASLSHDSSVIDTLPTPTPSADTPPLMSLRSVSDWSRHGGAFLRSSRSEEFRTETGVLKAVGVLRQCQIDALIPIGGDGTMRGCVELQRHWNGQILGLPGTIDNDLHGSDFTIGFSTAVRTAVEAMDKLRDTAESHERLFLIEVMGRHSGYIAVYAALAGAAEVVCVPETDTRIPEIVEQLRLLRERKKASVLMVVAEGDEAGDAAAIARQLEQAGCPYAARVVVLGHIQRGGTPTPEDRVLASELGSWAVDALLEGHSGALVGKVGGVRQLTPFSETFQSHRPLPPDLRQLIETLAQ